MERLIGNLRSYAPLNGDLFRSHEEHGRFTPFFKARDDMEPGFAPIVKVLALLKKLHRGRNFRPLTETIRRLLDAARAQGAAYFRKPGTYEAFLKLGAVLRQLLKDRGVDS